MIIMIIFIINLFILGDPLYQLKAVYTSKFLLSSENQISTSEDRSLMLQSELEAAKIRAGALEKVGTGFSSWK